MGELYVFHQGYGGDNINLWYTVFDGLVWRGDRQISNLNLWSDPSAVGWKDGISVFHQGWNGEVGPDSRLWYTFSTDGVYWGGDTPLQQVYGYTRLGSPSTVVYNDNLYVFRKYDATVSVGQLAYSIFDGANWHGTYNVPNVGMGGSPSAVAWKGGIAVFHQGIDGNYNPSGQLWYTYSPDGIHWGGDTLFPNSLGMSESVAAVVAFGNLFVFHQGERENGQLWYTYTSDGIHWSEDTQILNLGMSGAPSAVAWAGGISVFHQGYANNGELWYTFSPDGIHWGADTKVPISLGMTGSPSCVVAY